MVGMKGFPVTNQGFAIAAPIKLLERELKQRREKRALPR
jgi:hypothetical protein